MAKNQDTLKEKIYGYLKGLGYEPELLASSGKEVPVTDEADIFRFTFHKDGEDYGTAYVSIDNSNVLTVYQSDELQNSPDEKTGDPSWEQVRLEMRRMSFPLGIKQFEVRNKNHLEYDMAKREHNKKLDEGYYPMGKKASYSDNIPETKMIIQHTRNIEEGEQRYRNVARIFVENMNGERFLLPTTKPGIGRVYARHIAEGGTPYDERGQHITGLVEEYSKMAGFVRATRNGQFNESAQKLVNEGINHYQKLRETLHKMTGKKGYSTYFESYTPPLMEDETQADLSEMFMSSSLDPRIECVMPILSKLSKNITEDNMKEIKSLEEWAESIAETPLKEFAPGENPGGNSGDEYIRTLASAWYNQDLSAIADQVKKDKNPKKKNMMDRVIDAQRAVEKILERGIVCGDGKVRKFFIDYNSDFDGVRVIYDDYADYSDYGDNGEDIDSRTGKPWQHSKYDDMEFKDSDLDEGIKEGKYDDEDDGLIAGRYTPQQWAKMVSNVKKLAHAQNAKKMATVSTNKPIGTRVADIGPGGKELNVKTDAEWNKQKDVAEGNFKQTPAQTQYSALHAKLKQLADSSIINTPQGKQQAGKIIDAIQKLVDTQLPGNTVPSKKIWLSEQGVAEGHTDQQRKIFKKNGKPVGEVGIDRESSPGNGQWYMKCYAYDIDNAGYDSYEEAVEELKHCLKQGVAEDLDANQKRVGQLGPTEKVKNNNIGKLVGTNESIDPLAHILKLIK